MQVPCASAVVCGLQRHFQSCSNSHTSNGRSREEKHVPCCWTLALWRFPSQHLDLTSCCIRAEQKPRQAVGNPTWTSLPAPWRPWDLLEQTGTLASMASSTQLHHHHQSFNSSFPKLNSNSRKLTELSPAPPKQKQKPKQTKNFPTDFDLLGEKQSSSGWWDLWFPACIF